MNANKPNDLSIFNAALEISNPLERKTYVDRACGDDAALRQKILSLLEAYERPGDTFDRFGDVRTIKLHPEAQEFEKPGTMIGRYKLLQKIGEGGCGVVYMAEQEEPVRRRVALKVIKLGMDTKSVIARFEAERQALALMDHPNIARILDGGVTESGRPYFVMDLVQGLPIIQFCDEAKLSTRQRLDLFLEVCSAIQHAHQKGIIHRDIKPSNILVTLHGDKPVPKVIDFGIAKATQQRLTDKTVFTQFQHFIGTPAYMSPEQATLSGLDIDTRSDIYSLGVLIYELLTGKTPFDAKELLQSGLDEMRRTIREKEPDRPSRRVSTLGGDELTTAAKRRGIEAPKLVNTLRGDLDWIVMKCLEKDRARRYETANSLASDIQRHLSNEPVVACPPSAAYRFRKMVRRNSTVFAAGTAVALALTIGLGISFWMFLRERHASQIQANLRREAETARGQAKKDADAARTEAEKSKQVTRVLQEMLQGAGPEVAKGRDATILVEIVDRTNERLAKELTNQPAVEAELCNTIGQIYEELGRYDKAEPVFSRAVAIARNLPKNEATVSTLGGALNNLGRVLQKMDRWPQAEAALRESLAVTRDGLGGQREETATVLKNLGSLLADEGKLAEAETNLSEALEIRRKSAGEQDRWLAPVLNDLAHVKQLKGQNLDAEALFRESLAIHRKPNANEDLEVAAGLDNLAGVLNDLEKNSEAEQMQREALSIYRKLLDKDHPDVALCLNNLALTLDKQGKHVEAEKFERESLDIQRSRFGNDHADTAISMNNLAQILSGQGKLAEAEPIAREALTIMRRKLGDNVPTLANNVGNLGTILILQDKFDEAERLFNEFLPPASKAQAGSAFLLQRRGGLVARRTRWKEAEADVTSALELRPADHMIWYQLAALYVQQGMLQEYRSLSQKALKRFQQTTNSLIALWISRTCLIAPRPGTVAEAIGKLADIAVADTDHSGWLSICNKSLAEYRAGRFSTALDWAQRATHDPHFADGPNFQVETYATLAMAHRQLEQTKPARDALADAIAVETKLPKIDNADSDRQSGYRYRFLAAFHEIVARALLREAKALIDGEPPQRLVQSPKSEGQSRGLAPQGTQPGSGHDQPKSE